MIDHLAKFLGALSIVGGGLTTLKAATTAKLTPVLLVGSVDPQAAMAWVQVIGASIPAIGGALVLLYGKWLETSKAGNATLQAKLDAVTAERDTLKARLEAIEKPGESKPEEVVE